MNESRLVLLTRPQAESEVFAALLRQRGLQSFIEPMLTIVSQPVRIPDLSDTQGLVFTSANGIRIFSELSAERHLPVYTVGRESALAAIEAGFENIISGEGGVDGLLPLMDKEALVRNGRRLLYLSGADKSRTFSVPGIEVENIVIYKAVATDSFTASFIQTLQSGKITDALFFSARTAQAFTRLLTESDRTNDVRTIRALCISVAVLECVRHLPWADVRVAVKPGRRGMLELL